MCGPAGAKVSSVIFNASERGKCGVTVVKLTELFSEEISQPLFYQIDLVGSDFLDCRMPD